MLDPVNALLLPLPLTPLLLCFALYSSPPSIPHNPKSPPHSNQLTPPLQGVLPSLPPPHRAPPLPLVRYHPAARPKTALSALFAPFTAPLPAPASLRPGYEAHNAHVRAVVPKDRLLEWHPRDGWEPLCQHLGVDVPEEFLVKEAGKGVKVKPFPNINEKGITPKILGGLVMFRWIVVGVNVTKFLGTWVLVGGVGWMGWRWRGRS